MNIIQWLRAKFAPDVEPERYGNTKDRSFRKKVKERRKKVECIEFEGVYYPVSDGGWWAECGALYVPKDAIVLVEDKNK